ncbi:hypothetical protein LZ30DRAFT_751357 [Colletotrichum cereale]|nr:hypothetical protein LZ30DRAFT_751357 [Colletotrichum cereale]
MDDKAGVATALLKRDPLNPEKPMYDRVILVFTGVKYRGRVAMGMQDYLKRAEQHNPPLPDDWRERTSWLQTKTNVLGQEMPHERWYHNLSNKKLQVATGQNLAKKVAKAGQQATVDFYHIAPCEDADVWSFIEATPNVRLYHLFFGYNSRQGQVTTNLSPQEKLALSEKQVQFHETLQDRLTARNPKAKLIFTQNAVSFSDSGGGSQDLEWSKKYFPWKDLTMALQDPFWTSNIMKANKYANATTQLVGLPTSISDPDHEAFMNEVVEARTTATALRKRILTMLKSAAESDQYKKDDERGFSRLGGVLIKEFSGDPRPTVELGDANHMAAVMQYLDTQADSNAVTDMKLLPAVCHSQTDPSQPPLVTAGEEGGSHKKGFVLTGVSLAKTTKFLEALFEQSSSTSTKEARTKLARRQGL